MLLKWDLRLYGYADPGSPTDASFQWPAVNKVFALKKVPGEVFTQHPFSRPLDYGSVCTRACMCVHVQLYNERKETGRTCASLSLGQAGALAVLPCCDTAASEWWFLSSDGSSLWRLLWKRKNQSWGKVCLTPEVWWEHEFDCTQTEWMQDQQPGPCKGLAGTGPSSTVSITVQCEKEINRMTTDCALGRKEESGPAVPWCRRVNLCVLG